MAWHVAFLRGMNLGGRRLTNATLCEAFARLGLPGATAFRASGNVLFQSKSDHAGLREQIEAGLREGLGYEVPTVLRTGAEVAELAVHAPFAEEVVVQTAGKLQVTLIATLPDAETQRTVLAHATEDDRLAFHDAHLFWLPRAGLSTSELPATAIERRLGSCTTRTQGTLAGIAKRCQ